MSENPSEQEPSIEEILSSIRQIISDDDDDSVDVGDSAEDDVLELTEAIEEEPPEVEVAPDPIEEEIDIVMEDTVEEEPEKELAPAPRPPVEEPAPSVAELSSEILSDDTKAAAVSSISKLAGAMPIGRTGSYSGVTLEDIVRELLTPMLKDWTDDNLADMVERIVQKELGKIARRAMDD